MYGLKGIEKESIEDFDFNYLIVVSERAILPMLLSGRPVGKTCE
jgi:hypothetical protein